MFYSLHTFTVFIVHVSSLHSPSSERILSHLFKTLCCYVAINYVSIVVTSYTIKGTTLHMGTAVAQWLRCCATNRKVAGSIPAGVSGFFIDIKSFRSHYGPGVDSASNRNEYQEYFLGVKAAGA